MDSFWVYVGEGGRVSDRHRVGGCDSGRLAGTERVAVCGSNAQVVAFVAGCRRIRRAAGVWDWCPAVPVGGAFPDPDDVRDVTVGIGQHRLEGLVDSGCRRGQGDPSRIVAVANVDGDSDGVVPAPVGFAFGVLAVPDLDGDRVAVPGLVIQGCSGFELTRCGVEVETVGAGTGQLVGEGIVFGIGGGDRSTDVGARGAVLRHHAHGSRPFRKLGRVVSTRRERARGHLPRR